MISVIISAVSSVASAISSAIGGIGSALGSFVTGMGSVIGGMLERIPVVIERVANIATPILQMLGVLRVNENIDDLGERALQAKERGIHFNTGDDFDAYLAKLRAFDIDPDVAAQRKPSERFTAGLAVASAGLAQKLNLDARAVDSLWLLALSHKMGDGAFITPQRLQNWLQTGRLGADIADYLDNRLSHEAAAALRDRLSVDMNGAPLSADEQRALLLELGAMREEWRRLKAQLAEGRA